LEQKGARVYYNDPFVPRIKPSRKFSRFAGRESSPLQGDYDLVVLCTAHSEYRKINPEELAAPILDTRGVFENIPGKVYQA